MIEQLLQMVAEGGVRTYDELAHRLSVSRPMLQAMLEDLSRLGYLSAVEEGCGGHCSGCGVGGCSVMGTGHLWTLTDKGFRAASQVHH